MSINTFYVGRSDIKDNTKNDFYERELLLGTFSKISEKKILNNSLKHGFNEYVNKFNRVE